jgi:hypothetical protein
MIERLELAPRSAGSSQVGLGDGVVARERVPALGSKLVTLPDPRMVDPVRRPREDLAVSRTLTVVALILVLAGCGGSNSESSDTSETTVEATETTTETTPTIVSNDPLACLEEAGLSNVEERDVGFWRGYHDEPLYAITIHKLATPAKAPTVVAGTYAVTGPFKVAAEGEGLSSAEGLGADALVQEVAACLGG